VQRPLGVQQPVSRAVRLREGAPTSSAYRVELPILDADGVHRVLAERLNLHCPHVSLGEAFEPAALDILSPNYSAAAALGSLRRVVRIANTAVHLALARRTLISSRSHLYESALMPISARAHDSHSGSLGPCIVALSDIATLLETGSDDSQRNAHRINLGIGTPATAATTSFRPLAEFSASESMPPCSTAFTDASSDEGPLDRRSDNPALPNCRPSRLHDLRHKLRQPLP